MFITFYRVARTLKSDLRARLFRAFRTFCERKTKLMQSSYYPTPEVADAWDRVISGICVCLTAAVELFDSRVVYSIMNLITVCWMKLKIPFSMWFCVQAEKYINLFLVQKGCMRGVNAYNEFEGCKSKVLESP